MSMKTSRLVRWARSCLSFSISAPLRPMMMPGRDVRMVMRSLLPGRSTSMELTPADFRRLRSPSLSSRSSWSSFGYPWLANQRERHGLLNPSRKPYGCTFCPMLLFLLLPLRHLHHDVRHAPLIAVRATHGGGTDALHAWTLVDVGGRYHQLVH